MTHHRDENPACSEVLSKHFTLSDSKTVRGGGVGKKPKSTVAEQQLYSGNKFFLRKPFQDGIICLGCIFSRMCAFVFIKSSNKYEK